MFQWTSFGKIKYNNVVYECDIVVDINGAARKRDYSISKEHYNTSHTVGQEELGEIIPLGTEIFIMGTGQQGVAELTPDAKRVLRESGIEFKEMPTPEAIKHYNRLISKKSKKVAALMHVTC